MTDGGYTALNSGARCAAGKSTRAGRTLCCWRDLPSLSSPFSWPLKCAKTQGRLPLQLPQWHRRKANAELFVDLSDNSSALGLQSTLHLSATSYVGLASPIAMPELQTTWCLDSTDWLSVTSSRRPSSLKLSLLRRYLLVPMASCSHWSMLGNLCAMTIWEVVLRFTWLSMTFHRPLTSQVTVPHHTARHSLKSFNCIQIGRCRIGASQNGDD